MNSLTPSRQKMLAVSCYWHDKREFRLWQEFQCFNDLPGLIQELYMVEARGLYNSKAIR